MVRRWTTKLILVQIGGPEKRRLWEQDRAETKTRRQEAVSKARLIITGRRAVRAGLRFLGRLGRFRRIKPDGGGGRIDTVERKLANYANLIPGRGGQQQ